MANFAFFLANMANRIAKAKGNADSIRDEWPRIREVTVKGINYFQVDGRPHFKRLSFTSVTEAKAQAEKWENTRARYGTAGKFIAERDATKFAEALTILAPLKAGIVDAARFYAEHLKREQIRLSGKKVAESLIAWVGDYEGKARSPLTAREIKSKATIFTAAFGDLRLSELTPARLTEWLERYESAPGTIASPQTRANLRTKLSQFCAFAKLQGWIEENPVELEKLERHRKHPLPYST